VSRELGDSIDDHGADRDAGLAARGDGLMRLIRLLLVTARLRLARYSLRASMCLAMIGRRLYRL
jgi:hypothetical protein